MNILIVEDNDIQRAAMGKIIKSISNKFNVYKLKYGEQALKIIKDREKEIDLFILDIGLPDISGLKIAKEIRGIERYELTHIIFITAYAYFQLDAFKKFQCYNFLEKPYKKGELVESVERLHRGVLRANDTKKDIKESICFDMKDYSIRIYLEDILFIESQGKYMEVHTINKAFLVKYISVKKMLKKISNNDFIQTHRSFIVNMNNITKIVKEDNKSWLVHLKDYNICAYVGKPIRILLTKILKSIRKEMILYE